MYAEFMRNGGANGGAFSASMEDGTEREDYIGGGMNGGIDGAISGDGRVEEIRSP